MAKPQMMVVVKVQDHDRLQSIQIYPVSSDSVNEKIVVASYEFKGMKTYQKIIKEHSSIIQGNLPNKCNISEILLPDDQLCPGKWNIVLKFIYQTVTGSSCAEDHYIEFDYPHKSFFPIIREVLEDLSFDIHWEKQEEMIDRYESPAYQAHQAYQDKMLKKNQSTLEILARTMVSPPLRIARRPIISEDQSTEKVERGTRVTTSSCEDIEEACPEVSELQKDATFKWYCCNYDAFQDHSAEDHYLMLQNLASADRNHRSIKGLAKVVMGSCEDIEEACPEVSELQRDATFKWSCCNYDAFQDHSAEDHYLMLQNLASGDRNHQSIKGLAKVVMGVSATASCGSSFALIKAAYAAAFIASLTAFWLPCKWKTTIRVLTKFGAIACAAGVLATIGYDLPTEYVWVAGLAFVVPAAAVALS